MSNIINALNSYGYGIKTVPNEEFMEICRENMDENIQGLITSGSFYDASEEDENALNVETSVNQTTNILIALGFYWPQTDIEYLKRFISHLKTLGFF